LSLSPVINTRESSLFPSRLGNRQDPANNLYRGAAFGVKSFFRSSADWRLLTCAPASQRNVLERCIFRHRDPDRILVVDAYDGARIREAVSDFVSAAAGLVQETFSVVIDGKQASVGIAGDADLLAYVGHDAFMDFQIPRVRGARLRRIRSDLLFSRATANPIFLLTCQRHTANRFLWTTGLMTPEAYTLKAALDGWLRSETGDAIRDRAAVAYNKYQKCGLMAARSGYLPPVGDRAMREETLV
jgi:hypothetical protein